MAGPPPMALRVVRPHLKGQIIIIIIIVIKFGF
jgi:hypothetical protein